jgi:hypothetical protein
MPHNMDELLHAAGLPTDIDAIPDLMGDSETGESSHIQDDAAEPAQTRDFTPLAHGREQRDVHPPPRYTPGVVSYLFYNLVNINY